MLYFYFYHPHDYLLLGLKFYSKDGAVILQAGADWIACGCNTYTVHLADGERVIGPWLADFMGGPVVLWSLTSAISSVRKSELETIFAINFIDRDKVVIVAEFVYGWEVSI